MADTEVEELGRRERKKLETRRALASAALRLATAKGPDHVTIEEIADAADVSVRTFFNYFSSKEEAIIGRDTENRAAMVQRLLDRPAEETPFEAVTGVIRAWFEDAGSWVDDRTLRQQLVRAHPSLLPRHLAALYDLERGLVEGLAQRMGLAPTDVLYPALLVTAAVNAMRVSLFIWEERERSVSLHALLDDAFAHLATGLATPPKVKKKP
ncbi:MAG: regulatory protein TetR [Actinomycetia bacterium]|nr:regulatory protein TetR [Actinomycetes bacterium]